MGNLQNNRQEVTKALKAETEETVLNNGEGKKLLLLLLLFIIFSLSGIYLHISTLIVDSRIFTHITYFYFNVIHVLHTFY
jgi:hypothetical protein